MSEPTDGRVSSACEHDWMERGTPGDLWQECFLCGDQRTPTMAETPGPSGRTPSPHDHDTECPSCYDCPGCNGADGSTPKRTRLVVRPGVVMGVCDDCGGEGWLCPNYVPTAPARNDR